jgi:hypothetical protein
MTVAREPTDVRNRTKTADAEDKENWVAGWTQKADKVVLPEKNMDNDSSVLSQIREFQGENAKSSLGSIDFYSSTELLLKNAGNLQGLAGISHLPPRALRFDQRNIHG